MKCYFLIFLLVFLHKLQAANFHFSSSAGNDERTAIQAQNPATPWKTVAKLNAIFATLNPGDSVFFMRGNIFEGQIIVSKSGAISKPIVVAAYGNGSRPVISGFTILSKWIGAENKIFECSSSRFLSSINMVVINGVPKAIGRYPNANAPNKGYLNYEQSVKNVQITDNQLSSYPNWTNGEVVIRKNRWVVDRNSITLHEGNTINYISGSHYAADINYGYFIQNHPKTLDQQGEWYFNAAEKKIGIYFDSATPESAQIKASTTDTLVWINNQSNIVFDNISFEGANGNAFEINNCNNIRVTDCEILFSGANAINAIKCADVVIENSIISYSNNNALNLNNCPNSIIRNNSIKCTGIFAGMGKGDSGSYEAIMIDGNNNIVELNKIDSTGYIPITFSGNGVTIKNNYINYFAFIKDDAGGIYTYNGFTIPKINYDRKITGNIILNGKGAGDGTPDTASLPASGIYMDDKVNNVEILNNTVANCSNYGIFIHNANTINIKGNTLFNNRRQLGLVHDNVAPDNPVKKISLINNILFSKNSNTVVAEYKTIGNDLKYFGNFDSNYYCRPLDDNFVLNISYVNSGTYFNSQPDLDGWKLMYGKDKASQKAPFKIASYEITRLTGTNKFGNGNFKDNISGLYTWSAAGNSIVSWNNNNILDGGSLQISFSKITGTTNRASVIIGAGGVIANKTYILRFSLKGVDEHQSLQVFLRKSQGDYKDLSERKNILISASRTENEILFTAISTQEKASIVFDVAEQERPLYMDNIQLYEAEVSPIDPDKTIRFEYNTSAAKRPLSISGIYIDARNKPYSKGSYLEPFSSVVLLRRQKMDLETITALPIYSSGGFHNNSYNYPGNNSSVKLVKRQPAKSAWAKILVRNHHPKQNKKYLLTAPGR
ncbi:MAG: right-handed parallel beta-helix repeat-containing protein [Ferruginibacter sp.]